MVSTLDSRDVVIDGVFERGAPRNFPEEMNMAQTIARVAVIGGAGYLGSTLCTHLLNLGYEVASIDTHWFGNDALTPLRGHPCFNSEQIDALHSDDVLPFLKGCQAVIWVAGLVGDPACDLDASFTYGCNYRSTLTMAGICKWLGIGRFIFASSCSVYGRSNDVMHLNEQSATNPLSFYAQDKLVCEKALRTMADDSFHPTILRLATLFGWSNRMRFDLVVNVLTARACKGETLEICGGGQRRPFLHVQDAARAFASVLSSDLSLVTNSTFNVGADMNNHRIIDIAEFVCTEIPSARVNFVPNTTDMRDYDVDFSKIAQTLGYKTEFSVPRGIAEIRERMSKANGINIADSLYINEKMTRQVIGKMWANGHRVQAPAPGLVGSAA
jgi:nucleoside-diphosphate-sugar epimerase